MNSRPAGRRAERTAQQAADSGPVKTLGRVGPVAYGVVHLLLAYLAVRVALGAGGKADKTGALQTIAEQPAGRFLLWVLTAGLIALAIWQLAEAGWGHGYRRPAAQADRPAAGQPGRGRGRRGARLQLLQGRLGQGRQVQAGEGGLRRQGVRLAGRASCWSRSVGLGIVAIAIYLVHRGVARTFVDDLDLAGAEPHARDAAIRFGQVGWPALGVAYGILGLLLVYSAVTYDPKKATGMDTALKTLAGQPYGTALLLIVAAGLACFGAYCLFDARYRRG